MDEFLNNNVTFEEDPKQNFHYRYPKELTSKHGCLNGQKGNFATIKLLMPQNSHLDECGNKRDFWVLCSLHSPDANNVLSAHLLMTKEQKNLNYKFIFEKMQEDVSNPLARLWVLRDCVIVRIEKNNYGKSLKNKMHEYQHLALPLAFEKILGELDLNDSESVNNSTQLNVCLGITIFEKNFYTNTFSLYRDTIYSCNIFHGDDLNIHKLCNIKGSTYGGTNVTILIKLPLTKHTCNISITKVNEESKETEWSTIVPALETFSNSSVTFVMPPYEGPHCLTEEIEVLIRVIIGNTTYRSNTCKFFYINDKKDTLPCKRPYQATQVRTNIVQTPVDAYVSRDKAPSESGVSQMSFNKQSLGLTETINTIFKHAENETMLNFDLMVFFDTLESNDDFIHLYKMADTTKCKNLVANCRNKYGENLLHAVCKINNFKRIRPLVGIGCRFSEQDKEGRTPLHIAIHKHNNDCILEIQNLIQDHSKYPEDVQENFINMLKKYDHDGYTVLHAALLGEHVQLFEVMLKFCLEHHINVLDYEVLGYGNSIAHLAIENNLINMLPLIQKYVPNYRSARNYNGKTIMDFKNSINEQMLQQLQID